MLARRHRSAQDGQIASGYAGVLAVAALVFAALFSLGLDSKVSASVHEAVCTITGGSNCAAPSGGGGGEHHDSGRADREIYDLECDNDLPGDKIREGSDGPSGNQDVDDAYDNLGTVYDYYSDRFNQDSFDDHGATIMASVNFCADPGQRGTVSYWDGERIRFAPGSADALDTAAHEFTHAITEHTAGLEYKCQPGALNEAISDMFAYNMDPDDTTYGEDRDAGAIRDYADPGRFGQPGHVDDYDATPNDGTTATDYGGVHTNSGIPNHAYYLLDQRVGFEKAEQILWKTVTEKLDHDSDFNDFRAAMLESARELYGEGDAYDGVDAAFSEVGLDGTWEPPEQDGC